MNTPGRRAAALLLAALALSVPAGTTAAGEAPKEVDPKAPCANNSCHADLAKKKHIHGPIAVGECAACHAWKDSKHEFKLAREGTKLCTACHDDMVFAKENEAEKTQHKLVVHEPVREDCVNCHTPHASDTKGLLVEPVLEVCGTCHDETVAKAQGKTTVSHHSAVLQGRACLACHRPHTSKFDKLLAAAPMDACLSCHDRPIKADGRTVANLKEEITAKKVVHGPIRDKECTACHDAHGSTHIALLVESYPAAFYAPFDPKAYALCFACHDEEMLAEAETDEATSFRNGKQNLHFAHVHKAVKGRTCRACHATHASDQPTMLRDSVPFGRIAWKLPIGFEKTSTGGTCRSGCHVPRSYDRDTPAQY